MLREVRPIRDNKTCWNSMVSMIKRSITSPCFEAIKKYLECYKDEELANNKLEKEDWTILKEIHEFLDTLL